MTSAVFEAHVREMDRIKAIKALSEADIVMLPHVTNYARKKWFEDLTKVLLPTLLEGNLLTFQGRKVSFKQLKRAFTGVAKRSRSAPVVDIPRESVR